ncbi:3-hydroxyacyl-ACP dehydratase FabZ family protein [Castellaniella caeni]|uniref:3-hydroxyacyl-ACP dehydratase FabZ family protein n=1 Tax=Castellaniella caeni TaxID=266123 RepID=UPI00083292CD|nr:hypothetical protein [Castellaniella caeni]
MKPTELQRQWRAPDQVALCVRLPEDAFWFQGHFEQCPILPGVVQVDWALGYAQALFGITAAFGGLDQVKFQSPARPGDTLWLSLHWLADLHRLDFTYEQEADGARRPLSRGRVRFLDPEGA